MTGTSLFLVPLQIIVILRTVALWDQNRKIIVLLAVTVLATDIPMFVTLVRVARLIRFSPDKPLAPILGCVSVEYFSWDFAKVTQTMRGRLHI